MATRNISTRISLDGEQEFKKQMTAVNGEMKNLKAEMRLVEAEYKAGGDAVALLTEKDHLLRKEIEQQAVKVAALESAVEDATKAYGEADSRTDNYRQSLLQAKTALVDMTRQLEENGKAVKKAEKDNDAFLKSVNSMKAGVKKAAPVAGKVLKTSFTAAAAAATAAITALNNVEESTREFRENQAKLQTAFEAAGSSADVAKEAYSGLYQVLGDDGAATEAAQLLAQLATNSQSVGMWTDIAAGVMGTFGDALPINSLIEAANETAKTGKVTGALADALNWAGISEDEFNAKLGKLATEEERAREITYILSRTYDDATDAFKANSAETMANREVQLQQQEALAKLGESVAKVKSRLSQELTPELSNVAAAFADVIAGTEGADVALQEAIDGLVKKAMDNLPEFLDFGVDLIANIATGIIESIPELVAAVPELAESLLLALKDVGLALFEAGKELFQDLWAGFTEALPAFKRKEYQANYSFGGAAAQNGYGGAGIQIGSHAGGLDFVPYDGYLAELHKGEAVLTAREASVLRALGGGLGTVRQGVTAAELQSVTAAAVNAMALRPADSGPRAANIQLVTPDGRTLAAWLIDDLRAVSKSNPEVT